jgi:hypothetical protein
MLFGETITAYCENHTEHTNTLCGQNVGFWCVKANGTYSNHWVLKGQNYSVTEHFMNNTAEDSVWHNGHLKRPGFVDSLFVSCLTKLLISHYIASDDDYWSRKDLEGSCRDVIFPVRGTEFLSGFWTKRFWNAGLRVLPIYQPLWSLISDIYITGGTFVLSHCISCYSSFNTWSVNSLNPSLLTVSPRSDTELRDRVSSCSVSIFPRNSVMHIRPVMSSRIAETW